MGERTGGSEYNLTRTPTWIVAGVCLVFISASLIIERAIHFLGKWLLKTKQKPLFDSLEKMKEDVMLLGFISLLLTVAQRSISTICILDSWAREMTPCTLNLVTTAAMGHRPRAPVVHAPAATDDRDPRLLFRDHNQGSRRIMIEGFSHKCPPGKILMMPAESLHQVHIFIFVMGVVHIFYSCMTVLLGLIQVRGWKKWEDMNRNNSYRFMDGPDKSSSRLERQSSFVMSRTSSPWCKTTMGSYLVSFFRQFGQSVTESDYLTLRAGFIKTHNAARTFNFHRYMIRTLEDDFKTVVGISSFLWCFVIIFMILNVHGWYVYFWMSFVPLAINMIIGTKLQHIITQLAMEVSEAHASIGLPPGPIKPRDTLFWFDRPQLLLYLIHYVFFQNAFELAFFLWLVGTYGFHSCMQDKHGIIYARVLMGVLVQFLCSYSTLPSYALVTQMGSHYKKAIFDEPVKNAILGWRRKARIAVKRRRSSGGFTAHNALGSENSNPLDSIWSISPSPSDKNHEIEDDSPVDLGPTPAGEYYGILRI